MRWDEHELAQGAELASRIASWSGPRCTRPSGPLTLRLSDAPRLKGGMPVPADPRAMIVRQLFEAMGLDERRIFKWRLDHKLVQALAVEQWCPGLFPATRGLGRMLAGMTVTVAREAVQGLDPSAVIVKTALGELSGEAGRADQRGSALAWLEDAGDAGVLSCPAAPYDERFVIQEFVRIDVEYRVHSLEDRVISDLTFRRYTPSETTRGEREAPAAFVRSILSRLPAGLVKDTLHAWDVARDRDGRWRIIEINPAGCHPVFKQGFHTSGFFQTPAWGPPSIARLLRFVHEHYGVPVEIVLDAEGPSPEHGAYWWTQHCKALLDETHNAETDRGGDARAHERAGRADERVLEQMRPSLSPAQNIFAWGLAEFHDVYRRVASDARPPQTPGLIREQGASAAVAPVAAASPSPTRINAADRERLRDWNRTARYYPVHECVHTLFRARARQHPDAPAVVGDAGTLTYAELDRRSNRLARVLRAQGVAAETRVGLSVARGAGMVVALLAIMKAGGTYVPLSTGLRPERLPRMAADGHVAVVVTDASTRGYLTASDVTAIDVDADLDCDLDLDLDVDPPQPDSLAYVLHTSGSTGRPKAVGVRHAALTNLLWDMQDVLSLTAEDRWLAITPLSFDIAGLEIYLPLIAGAQVWIAGETDFTGSAALMRRLSESAATTMQATPMTWQLLIEAGWNGGPMSRALTGGERLPEKLAKALAERVAVAWNLYGPTETTIWSSRWIIDEHSPAVSVGRPLANTTLYVLNSAFELQPPGVAGELYIGGDGLARGYLNQAGLTAERFVPDPYAASPGARMYSTGDWARWADGPLELLGRTDDQVKINGVRIECEGIECVLREHADVREAAIVGRRDAHGQTRLVAFIVQARATSGTFTALKTWLRERLPEFTVPLIFVALDRLPRTAHGKVDRHALVWVDEPRNNHPASQVVALKTSTEARLAGIWSSLLGIEAPGADDDFLELGGQSLAAIQCIHRVREIFGIELPLIALFDEPATIRTVAAAIDEQMSQATVGASGRYQATTSRPPGSPIAVSLA